MKKKHLIKIGAVLLLAFVVFVATTHQAHAQWSLFNIAYGTFNELVAMFFNTGLKIMSWILAIAGFLLNVSIRLTLNIKAFVDNAPAIYTTWKAIRDISGIFIIFFLLYASVQLILGLQDPKFKELIKNIVMAGILINFSFFLTGLGIDASNIVSMQLYNAIAPANTATGGMALGNEQIGLENGVLIRDGGLSDIFMNSLKITKLYDFSASNAASGLGSSNGTTGLFNDTFKIIMVGIIGIIIEFVATISFAAAAFAFIARFVILLFLLAFSPVYFISFLAPEVKTYAGKWWDLYKSMLLFMPVYLLLMYLALNVLTTTPMFDPQSTTAAVSAAPWYREYMLLAVNATIVIFLLNLPLVAAASIAGKTISILNKAADKFGAGKVWSTIGGYAGTKTIGAGAARLDKAMAGTKLGNTLLARDIRGATTGALAKSKMGGMRSHEERQKEQKEVSKEGKIIDRKNNFNSKLNAVMARTGTHADLKTVVSVMSTKEKTGAITAKLKEKDDDAVMQILKHASREDFASIAKSEDISDEDKNKILDLRGKALEDSVTREETEQIKHMTGEMNGKDLLDVTSRVPGPSLLEDEKVIEHLTAGQLKAMGDEGIDTVLKKAIGNKISGWRVGPAGPRLPHKAEGFVNKPSNSDWL